MKLCIVVFMNCKHLKGTVPCLVAASDTATEAEILEAAKQEYEFLMSTETTVKLVLRGQGRNEAHIEGYPSGTAAELHDCLFHAVRRQADSQSNPGGDSGGAASDSVVDRAVVQRDGNGQSYQHREVETMTLRDWLKAAVWFVLAFAASFGGVVLATLRGWGGGA